MVPFNQVQFQWNQLTNNTPLPGEDLTYSQGPELSRLFWESGSMYILECNFKIGNILCELRVRRNPSLLSKGAISANSTPRKDKSYCYSPAASRKRSAEGAQHICGGGGMFACNSHLKFCLSPYSVRLGVRRNTMIKPISLSDIFDGLSTVCGLFNTETHFGIVRIILFFPLRVNNKFRRRHNEEEALGESGTHMAHPGQEESNGPRI